MYCSQCGLPVDEGGHCQRCDAAFITPPRLPPPHIPPTHPPRARFKAASDPEATADRAGFFELPPGKALGARLSPERVRERLQELVGPKAAERKYVEKLIEQMMPGETIVLAFDVSVHRKGQPLDAEPRQIRANGGMLVATEQRLLIAFGQFLGMASEVVAIGYADVASATYADSRVRVGVVDQPHPISLRFDAEPADSFHFYNFLRKRLQPPP